MNGILWGLADRCALGQIGLTDQEIYILSTNLNANPQPTIATISPASAVVGGDFILTVNGSGFTSASTVTWNLTPRTTTFVNDKQLTVAISYESR